VPVGIERGVGDAEAVRALAAAGGLAPRFVDPSAVEISLRDGVVDLVVRPGTPPVYRFDPDRPESRTARLLVDEALQRAAGRADVWRGQDAPVRVRGARYVDWLVPGLLGLNIMGTGIYGIGFAVVQARTRKLLKRLMATPMRRSHYLLSHVLARLVFLALEVSVLVGFAWLAFDVQVAGSLVTLAVTCVMGALAFGGLGLLLASRARTIEAVSGLMNVAMVPMWILSGVFFASERFPAAMQPFITALPLTAINSALRAVMNDGAGLPGIAAPLGILAAWGLGCFGLALRIFRWR
jgi:ABC-type polysaccharide/polyol phosphate export permease